MATVCTSRLFYREPGDWFLIILPIVVRCFIRLLSRDMNPHAFRTGKFLSSQIRYCFAMDRKFKIAVICLLAVAFSGCISSNPSSEVMVDTNAKRKQALPGEAQDVGPLPQAY